MAAHSAPSDVDLAPLLITIVANARVATFHASITSRRATTADA